MATNAEKLQLVESDLRKLDDELAKNAEDRRQLRLIILGREKEKEDCKHLWREMESLNVDRDKLLKKEEEKKLAAEDLKKTLAAEADGASTIAVPDAHRPRDQQATAHSSPAPLRKSAVWWPASWLQSVAPLWQVRGDVEGSLWQRQQQEDPTAAAPTMLASAGPQSGGDPHTSAITNSVPNSSAPPSQYLSTCRQRRSRADPQQAASEGTP